jgi:hypothetical protein
MAAGASGWWLVKEEGGGNAKEGGLGKAILDSAIQIATATACDRGSGFVLI